MGTGAEIRVRYLSLDTYYLVASDGWEALGMVDRRVYRGVFHYNAARDSSQRGVTGLLTFDVTPANELHVRTSVTGRSGETTDIWQLVDSKTPPVPAALPVPVIPPYEKDPPLDARVEPLLMVRPEYPDVARQAGVDGTVTVGAYVLADGSVADVRVVKSIAMLDAAAMAAVRRSRFEPPQRNGRPVPAWVTVPVVFTLH
jgi:TonB family protein